MASSTASRLVAALSLALVLGASQDARAQDTRDPKLAQSLFDRARALMDQSRYAEACPLLEESQRLDPGGGTLLNLAVCLEGAGKLATAHTTFHEALSQAIRDGRDDRKKIAEERVKALAPKLSTITIDVPAGARVPDLAVWLDGKKLAPIAWGVPTAVDGGEHRVETTAPDAKPWFTVVDVSPEGHKVTVRVEPPRSLFDPSDPEPAPERPAKKKKKKKRRAAAAEDERRPPEPPKETKLSTASWAVGGVGLGLLVVGGAMGIAAVVQDDQLETEALEEGCNLARGYCPDEDLAADYASRADSIQALGWAATASLAAGATLVLIAPLLPRDEVATPAAAASTDGVWVGVRGRF